MLLLNLLTATEQAVTKTVEEAGKTAGVESTSELVDKRRRKDTYRYTYLCSR